MLCIAIHFQIVFGYGQYDCNQNRIRIGDGYHFSKTGYDRIVKIHYLIISAGKSAANFTLIDAQQTFLCTV